MTKVLSIAVISIIAITLWSVGETIAALIFWVAAFAGFQMALFLVEQQKLQEDIPRALRQTITPTGMMSVGDIATQVRHLRCEQKFGEKSIDLLSTIPQVSIFSVSKALDQLRKKGVIEVQYSGYEPKRRTAYRLKEAA